MPVFTPAHLDYLAAHGFSLEPISEDFDRAVCDVFEVNSDLVDGAAVFEITDEGRPVLVTSDFADVVAFTEGRRDFPPPMVSRHGFASLARFTFPDFDDFGLLDRLVRLGAVDISYGKDVCPSVEVAAGETAWVVFVDYGSRNLREMPDGFRFVVSDPDQQHPDFATNDFEAMLAFVRALPGCFLR